MIRYTPSPATLALASQVQAAIARVGALVAQLRAMGAVVAIPPARVSSAPASFNPDLALQNYGRGILDRLRQLEAEIKVALGPGGTL